MKIQNHGEHRREDARVFECVLDDLVTRELPDIGLTRTNNSGMRWNDAPLETLSATDPRSSDWRYHFGVVLKEKDNQPTVNAILCGTNKGNLSFYQDFEIDLKLVSNLVYEVVKFFLEKCGKINTDREGIELLYPAFGLEVPPLPIYEDPQDKPKATYQSPLPDVVLVQA